MGFNRRKIEAERKTKTDAEIAARRATDAQVLQDAERLISAWKRTPSPAHAPRVRTDDRRRPRKPAPLPMGLLPACRTTRDIELRTLDRHRDAAVTSLIPSLSCRSCRPHALFVSSCACPKPASPTKCGSSTRGESLATRPLCFAFRLPRD
jgi:hypothetical protein